MSPSRITQTTTNNLQVLMDEYWEALQASQLADKSIEDYFYFAYCFVRWCNGEFEPGAKVR